ncbi:hypothetical protein XENORESO_016605 [Xenotaenia resolanae]|uniref:Uncharacterized protein n=1 Tax=Xenotaenia resolanae TaxID=208358 RepID=A0ABV0WKP1_9TELE
MFCFRHPLCKAERQERGEPTVAIWRKSLNVRTPMGNRRAPAVAAIKPATLRSNKDDPGSEKRSSGFRSNETEEDRENQSSGPNSLMSEHLTTATANCPRLWPLLKAPSRTMVVSG